MPNSTDRSTLLALGLVLLVGMLAVVAWSASLLTSGDTFAFEATATPTKTPGASLASSVKGQGLALSRAPLPTLTPTPEPARLPAPGNEVAPKVPPQSEATQRAAAIAEDYGLNPAGDYIIVDQDAQEMLVVEAGEVVRVMAVTTGDPSQGWETPAWFGVVGEYWGSFQGAGGVMADDGWWLFQRGGNFLIHGLPYTLDASGRRVYAGMDDLGAAPASHGCIRLHPEDARWFTRWRPQGKPIIILPPPASAQKPGS
jgi:lipoprotein-anchoring transpeptidase ErfK/SrfK